MAADDQDDMRDYIVVINHEEQYSIWPNGKQLPDGWHSIGKEGRRAELLEYIARVWVDMRPLSLRKKMDDIAD